jgi:hypothetical protein
MRIEIHPRDSAIELSRRLIWLGSMIWILNSPLQLQAASVIRSGLIEVTTTSAALGTAFNLGDVFEYHLAFDDSILDLESDPDYGEFQDAITSLTIIPLTSRAGIWSSTGNLGTGTVYTERGAGITWSYDLTPNPLHAPAVNGYTAALFYMGFAGLPENFDTGDGQTLGQVTGNILESVSMGSANYVEMNFEQGANSEIVGFRLINFHAPEPGRLMLVLFGLSGAIFRRRRH